MIISMLLVGGAADAVTGRHGFIWRMTVFAAAINKGGA